MLSGARGKVTAVTRAGREHSETVAKQKQLPSAGVDSMYVLYYFFNLSSPV